MSYHPIMGVTIFILFLLFAFFLGRRFSSFFKKNNIQQLKKKNFNADSISPDAHWLNKK